MPFHAAAARGPSIKKPRSGLGFEDGAKRIRTADPLHAMQVLYQLSYGPIDVASLAHHMETLQRGRSGLTPGARPPPASPGS